MGISSIGQRMSVHTIRYAVATAMVVLGLFYYLYGPPLTPAFARAAERECVALTGENYRTYRLEWRSTWYGSLSPPHWSCTDTRTGHQEVHDLGWWVDL